MKHLFTFLIAVASVSILSAQAYNDYFGAGHSAGISVTSSSQEVGTQAIRTIDGVGMDSRLFETGRFLSQATMGADLAKINAVKDMDFEDWIDDQLTKPITYLEAEVDNVWAQYSAVSSGDAPGMKHFHYGWWQNAMTADDELRQKVAFALSQILVVSSDSDLGQFPQGMASYYDILLDGAFGNYKDILKDVSIHPTMGFYLSHLNNPKAIPSENQHPDENYAREIMQLFSIGLYELNNDGTLQLDGSGNSIPTYDNNDIKEMAKIFTGLGGAAVNPDVPWAPPSAYFGLGIFSLDMTVPMKMYEDWHETEAKVLFNNTIPANQPGMTDINQAIDILFNHQNVPPFVSYRLIQRLVKSNPTPAYVSRVANVFINNGNGQRGDIGAVVKAILLDDEARNGDVMFEQHSSRLREPFMRHVQVTKGLEVVADPSGRFWNFRYENQLKQKPLNSPSVFNFYLPNHSPVGDIATLGFVAPEFKIHDTGTSIAYFNTAHDWTEVWWRLLDAQDQYDFGETTIDFDAYTELADEPELLINELDKVLTHGQLSDEVRQSLRTELPNIVWGDWELKRVQTALYLIMISPDFSVIR